MIGEHFIANDRNLKQVQAVLRYSRKYCNYIFLSFIFPFSSYHYCVVQNQNLICWVFRMFSWCILIFLLCLFWNHSWSDSEEFKSQIRGKSVVGIVYLSWKYRFHIEKIIIFLVHSHSMYLLHVISPKNPKVSHFYHMTTTVVCW